jgi:SAM-dependent methyltransferase
VLTVRLDALDLRPGNRVLDLGCGDGRHTRGIRLLPGITTVALDIGEKEVATAAESLRAMEGPDASPVSASLEAGPWLVIRGDGYRLPFGDASFDCVIVSEVLEHLREDDQALREVSRVLRPGGRLAVTVPRWWPERVCWALSAEYPNSEGGHVRIYRRRALTAKLAAHGYAVDARHHAHALHSPFWWLKCAVGLENESSLLVRAYHRFLVWDLMKRPRLTRTLERLLDPVLGKSVAFYARKQAHN